MDIKDFSLERFFAKYEFSAKYLLCSSDPEALKVSEVLDFEDGSYEMFKDLSLAYTETTGNVNLKKEILKLYHSIHIENILVTASSEEAIFLFSNCALEKGDHIIVQFPNYQSLEEVARAQGCEITRWEMNELNNWTLDIDFLKKQIRPNTRAIILNSPHNPTGAIISKECLNEIITIARRSGILILLDEVYRYLEYNANDRLPPICDLYENGFSICGMSKAFSLPGLRIGWIVTKNKSILNKMTSFKDYTTICSSAPSEFLSTIALRNKEKILKRNMEIISSNLKMLESFFNRHKDIFGFSTPRAGTITFPRLQKNIDSEDFCVDLVEKKNIMLLPSTKYEYGNKNIRFGFGRKNMPEVLSLFEEYVIKKYKS